MTQSLVAVQNGPRTANDQLLQVVNNNAGQPALQIRLGGNGYQIFRIADGQNLSRADSLLDAITKCAVITGAGWV